MCSEKKDNKLKKAVFLDRDGTIIIDHGYIKDPDKVELLPNALEALDILLNDGFLIFIITNQSGIGRGIMSIEDVNSVNKKLLELLGTNKIKEILICPHSPEDNCDCRKPKTKLVDLVIQNYKISPVDSYSVGDKDSDRDLGYNFGGTGIKLGENGLKTLFDVAKYIRKESNKR
jgi:D-glycero-D-manno-heptose 1,7-bisphosphate phosphatase